MFKTFVLRRLPLVAALIAGAAFATVVAAGPEDEAQLKRTGSCAGCNLVDADLQGINAERGDLSNANLAGANLYRAVLTGANLAGANLYRAVLTGANLTGANFNGANLSGANLSLSQGSDLSTAITDNLTVCPSGSNGPCRQGRDR